MKNIVSIILIVVCGRFGSLQQADSIGQKFSITLERDSIINFRQGENKEFYDYLAEQMDVGKIKHGQYSQEKIIIISEYSLDGHLDRIDIKTISGEGVYNKQIEKYIRETGHIRFKGFPEKKNGFKILLRMYIWEEAGDFILNGYLIE